MEHRWGERFRVNLTVTVRDSKGWTVVARVRDVSISGAFLECRHAFDSASWVSVNFGHGASAADGYIARLTREGIGIEWAEFAPDAVTDLLRSRAALQRYRPAATSQRRGGRLSVTPEDNPQRLPRKPPSVAPTAGSGRGSRRR